MAAASAVLEEEIRMHLRKAEIFRFHFLLHLRKLQRAVKRQLMFRGLRTAVIAAAQVLRRALLPKPASSAAAEVWLMFRAEQHSVL